VPGNAEATEIIQRTPGGVAVVGSEAFEDKYTLNFEDTLALTPGVYAQKRFGEEVRLSIRGSGLSRGFHMRGLSLLQDGIPFNLADGAGDFQEADSLAFQRLEVYKGANALQYGGTSLGGAINMVTKTGHSQPGNQLRMELGSDDTYRGNVQSGQVFGESDLFLSLTGTTSDGFREHDHQSNVKFNGNFGTALSERAETRFYLSANDLNQKLPGSVSRSDALNHPESAGSGVVASDQARDMRSVRLSNKTTLDIGDDDQLDVGVFVNTKDLYHPITPFVGVIDQESVDYGVFVQASGEHRLAEHRNVYRVGVTSHLGEVEAKVYQNIGGSRGNLLADANQESRNVALYGENAFYLTRQWALVTGAQLTWSERELTDQITPSESDSKIYRAFNPKIGVLYQPNDLLQYFANVSKSHETPTFSELTQGGTVGFTPIDAQQAWTVEIGTRGETGRLAWDVSLYRAWVDHEMLQFTTGPSIPASTFNADDTVHQGLELGLTVLLADSLFAAGDQLQWRNAYTYSDYYFDGDSQYGDNEIAGQPKHFYQTELRYEHAVGWHVALDWELAGEADVDFANTLETPGYGILGLNAGYDINDQVNLYVDGRNLLDKGYISTFSTIVNTAGNTNVFYPGEGRSLFAGVRVKF
jgi:iron complex outermembrane receptor protein